MYKGYPVGYFLFWANANIEGTKGIGTIQKQKHPALLIVDGQQRLTSLYAVIKGQEVIWENYEKANIIIAFNPLEEKFEIPMLLFGRTRDIFITYPKYGDQNQIFLRLPMILLRDSAW